MVLQYEKSMKVKTAKAVGALIGGALGLVLAFYAFMLAGAGHGTLRPFYLFFGPVAFLGPLGLLGGIFLYALYGMVLATLSRGRRRRQGFTVVAILHYGCSYIAYAVNDEGPNYFEKVMRSAPEFVYQAGSLFAAANLTGLIVACIPPKMQTDGSPPLCRKCGYNLTGNVSGRCPECGLIIHAPPEVNLSAK
jgi:hypothetical protein